MCQGLRVQQVLRFIWKKGIRNLTLGYTMPKSISKKFYVERLRVYASGENLFAITGFSGMDPEMRVSMGYSTMRQYAFGINLTF